MSFMFENLHVYQKSLNFAEKVSNITETFPRGSYYIADQFNRASLSICLNIAEGNGKFHKNDRKQFFYISRGSVNECVPLIELIYRKNFIDDNKRQELREELAVISKMLSGHIKGLDS